MTRFHVTGRYRTESGRAATFQRAIVALDSEQAMRIARLAITKTRRYAGKLDLRAAPIKETGI